MKSHLLDHPKMYVPISLICNHEISYTHYMRLHITMQVLTRNQGALTKVNRIFQSLWSCRHCLDRINFHQRVNPLVGWHLNFQLQYAVYFHSLWQCGKKEWGRREKNKKEKEEKKERWRTGRLKIAGNKAISTE